MKNSLIALLFVSLFVAACSGSKETPSGYKFNVVRKGDGVKIDSGKFVVMNLLFMDGKDSVWNDSKKNGFPAVIQMQGTVPKGDAVLEVIKMMSKGDSVVFKVPAKKLFENTFRQPLPFSVDSTSSFTFQIGLSAVLNQEEMNKLQTELVAKQNEKMLQDQKAQLGKDITAIDDFLKAKNVTAQTTTSGLRYIITKPGTGENAKAGQQVKIDYLGYLLNGKYFDTSIESEAKKNNLYTQGRPYSPLELTVGAQQVIPGWEEAIQLMNKGAKMTVYIPSTLAYGNQRRGDVIAENSVLVFDMELIEVK
ncbi:MAG: FKBP-type peptidyl-prolyl cis-trans isomerase [Cytophagales bacterium]|jgi:FKBP-type peptidyl-prolyl cis-trans isomerase FkpA|nr:FKBP-type peptidyl-prolyl cis-trans isomerase [Cytophagales bacterium]MCA6387132.1 FKBP-type peptidyl-prolyl cis-trans isomerase [Cytophagales bacterium]MCA6390377.1 FKBP-type peptidyl-prolyl cis-trans isomerase [Cytophagales bacterium]MCA6396118.1 FKBP-type peptidyl-prolyl cis-trans isomerase [Cytophagales bacterium]MCA6399715.1 FKBP-type peptidyl-prolyl cis-trans isomerase [Cytophagales bacterium]